MANTFVNAGIAVGATRTTLYTAPSATQSVVHALYISNVDGTNSADITVEATVDGGTTYFTIIQDAPVPAGGTIVFDKPINLEASDILAVTASEASDLEAFASVLEIT